MSNDSMMLAKYIDHTQLRPDASESDIRQACEEALEYRFCTVCVRPEWVGLAASLLSGSSVLPITVVGFPEGNFPTSAKVTETQAVVADGAKEVDMVLNRELLAAGDTAAVQADVEAVVKAAGAIPVKVILEVSELTPEQIAVACQLCKIAGAAFVKTSTGFSSGGATVEAVKIMRETVGPNMGVKASGGIRTTDDARRMIEAGASRLGCSASIAIIKGQTTNSDY